MKKISVNMLSIADKVEAQGVDTAYEELMNLLNKYGKKDLKVVKNKGLNYDILHMHTVNPMSYIKQRLTKNATLTYVHYLPNNLEGALRIPKLALKVYEWWTKRSYLKSDYLVVVNPTYIEELSKMGFPKEKIFYIPNFVSSDNFYKMSKSEIQKYRKKYNYNEDDFIVISVGQLHKGKGIFDFIKIAKENPDIKFIWVGGFTFGKFMESYDKIKKVYDNPPENLTFTGIVKREEVNILCNISDVFFMPSHYESFALVALEAAHTEKPLVLRDLDTYKDVYFDNFLKGKNNKEFIKEIRMLKDDKKLYNEYVSKSKKIKSIYNDEAIYKKWLNLYTKISKKNQ